MKNLKVDKVINKIRKIKEKYPIMTFYIIGNFINAILVRLFTTGHFQVRSIFFDLAFILALAGLSLKIKKRRNIYYYVTTIVMMLICMINSLYSFIRHTIVARSVVL